MTQNGPRSGQRLTALVLTLALLVLLIIGLSRRMLDIRLDATLAFGAVCGGWFTIQGDLPSRLRDWLDITEDNDPRNIPPRIYLPILLTLLILGAAAIAFVISQ